MLQYLRILFREYHSSTVPSLGQKEEDMTIICSREIYINARIQYMHILILHLCTGLEA